MKTTKYRLWGLDWRVLLALPVLAVAIGLVNNRRVPEDMRVSWSGARTQTSAKVSATVRRGEWTSDFIGATNVAETAHLPVVVIVWYKGCTFCSRLHEAVTGVAARKWMKARGWYFVLVEREKSPEAVALVTTTPNANKFSPYVGVYWTRADGTRAMGNFTGRHEHMGVRKEKLLALEWMRAVERIVKGAPGMDGGLPAASFVKSAKFLFSVGTTLEGAAQGQVSVSPKVTSLLEGQKAKVVAHPARGSVLAGWRYPDGRMVHGTSSLTIAPHYPQGRYTAVFRRPEDCAAPVLKLPNREVVWNEFHDEILRLRVNEDAYPVVYGCTGLPKGMSLTSSAKGIIAGTPVTNGVWDVTVTARGASGKLPPAKGTFKVRVIPAKRPPQEESENKDDRDTEGEVE